MTAVEAPLRVTHCPVNTAGIPWANVQAQRRKGVARALKQETLAQALELGVEVVETDNDSENAPILHLNEELGYREVSGMLQLYKQLAVPGEQ